MLTNRKIIGLFTSAMTYYRLVMMHLSY